MFALNASPAFSFLSSQLQKQAHLCPMHNHAHHTHFECGNCSVQGCPARGVADPEQCMCEDLPFQGVRFSLISAWFFLSPIFLGIIGALCMGGDPSRQLVGSLIGFFGAVLLNPVIARLFQPKQESQE